MSNHALLLSAYDAQSHRHWHEMLTDRIADFKWTVLTLPARHFFWRSRSNGLSFALQHSECLSAHYDVIITTSMLDLATLRGLVPALASIPALVYFHENQFDYPLRDGVSDNRILNAQLTSIITAMSADRLLFNSEYNKRTFLIGTQNFISRMPDGLSPAMSNDIEKKSSVLPVPIHTIASHEQHNPKDICNGNVKHADCVDLVWAHRWEFDKQPDVFFDALEKLYNMPEFKATGLTIRLHVMGQSFRDSPECFQQALSRDTHNVVTWGYQKRDDYFRILGSSDIVVSTALHDFQGLSMLEAIHRGCIPVAPNRVAYPEYIPNELLYDTGQPESESTALAKMLCQLLCNRQFDEAASLRANLDISGFMDNQLIVRYQTEINALLKQ